MAINLFAVSPDLGRLAFLFTSQSEQGLKACILDFTDEDDQSEKVIEWLDGDPETYVAKRDFFELREKIALPSEETILQVSTDLWNGYRQKPSVQEFRKKVLEGNGLGVEDYEQITTNLVEQVNSVISEKYLRTEHMEKNPLDS